MKPAAAFTVEFRRLTPRPVPRLAPVLSSPPRAATATLPKRQAVERPKGPARTPPQWRPGGTMDELRAQLDDLLLDVPDMLRGPVLPLAFGAREFFAATARPGRKQRCARWLRAWCSSESYLRALATPGTWRHDRHGNPVEPVAVEHAEEARRRLDWLERRRQQRGARG